MTKARLIAGAFGWRSLIAFASVTYICVWVPWKMAALGGSWYAVLLTAALAWFAWTDQIATCCKRAVDRLHGEGGR